MIQIAEVTSSAVRPSASRAAASACLWLSPRSASSWPLLLLLSEWLEADRTRLILALTILCVGQLVNVAAGPAGQLLVVNGHAHDVTKVTLGAALIVLVLGSTGAILGGVVGLAAATAIAIAFRNATSTQVAVRRLGMNVSVLSGIKGTTS